ncbi:MAG TPA: trigger factor [Solirubrobacteraceae bacterium]|jgi:trigger factor
MSQTLTTTVTELPESRVRLEVQVPAEELERSVERKARQLGRELKLPGFRKGKVPAPLVIQRVGRDTVLEEAVRDTLSSWYADALDTAGVVPVGDPDVDLGEMPPQGQALEFSIEIGVLPTAELGQYKGLEVPRREAAIEDGAIQMEVEKLRERLARLDSVERPAASGDFLVVDYVGSLVGENGELEPFKGGEGRDQLIELGSGNLIPGFEEALVGASAGETRTIELSFPEDYSSTELAGRSSSFAVTVKDVKAKDLPELDDNFAADLGFDTLDDLRADIRNRLSELEQARIEDEFRDAALDAAAEQAQMQIPDALIKARAKEMWERTLHSLSHQGISRENYLRIAGREETQVLAEIEPDAEQALRREAVLSAVVAAESITPSDQDVLEAITPLAQREDTKPEKLLADLERRGRLEEVREELAARQAMDLIAEQSQPIGFEQAAAREKLWTPSQEDPQGATGGGELWTPDS